MLFVKSFLMCATTLKIKQQENQAKIKNEKIL